MSNGRMTFRFDVDKDMRKSEPPERRSDRGLGTAYDTGFDKVQEEPPENPGVVYREPQTSHPRHPENEVYSSGSEDPRENFFRSDPAADLWEISPRKTIYPIDEGEHVYGERYLDPDWKPESDRFGDISLSDGGYGGSYHTRRPSYWWKFALSIAGAVGTGVLLGYAALSFFSGGMIGGGNETAQMDTSAVQSGNGAVNSQKSGNTGLPLPGTGSASVARIPVGIAAQSYYLLQYGVFSTPAGAEQAKQELLDAGLAAGLDPADGNRVYAGMSPDREQAKLLSSGLKNQGIELYVREVVLPAAEQASFAGTAETVNSYFAVSGKLLNELSGLSASLLSGANQAADTSSVSDLHMQWNEAVKALEPGLSPDARSICAELEKSMSQAISALNEYNKNKAQGLMWEVQEAMMSFLTGQKSLLSAIG